MGGRRNEILELVKSPSIRVETSIITVFQTAPVFFLYTGHCQPSLIQNENTGTVQILLSPDTHVVLIYFWRPSYYSNDNYRLSGGTHIPTVYWALSAFPHTE